MLILAVETCLGACSVALLRDREILAHRWLAMERGHAEALAPMVQDAMHGNDLAALDRLAVTVGPGTFTGQRVGLSFMRGLRLALDKPLTGVTSLEAMAAAACAETVRTRAAAIYDARRDEAYLSLVEDGVAGAPIVVPFARAVEAIRAFGPCVLAGTGAPAAHEALGEGFLISGVRQPDALFVARLAAAQSAPPSGALPPAPLYLRAPDAKLPAPSKNQIRELVTPFAGDATGLATLHAAAFAHPWDAAALRDLLAGLGVFAFAAPSGFVLARAAGGEAEILTLAVLPSARGKGLGRALMQSAAAHAVTLGAENLFLEVGGENPAALALYTSLGFQRVGSRKGYYDTRSQEPSGSGDALVLKATLPLAGNLP